MLEGALMVPYSDQAEFIAILEPVGDLLDGGLLYIVGQGGLARTRGCTGQDKAARVCDSAS